jgi:hypothetical protein
VYFSVCRWLAWGEKLALVQVFTKPLRHRIYNLLKQQTPTSCLQAFTKLEISKHGTGAQISVFILRILAIVLIALSH